MAVDQLRATCLACQRARQNGARLNPQEKPSSGYKGLYHIGLGMLRRVFAGSPDKAGTEVALTPYAYMPQWAAGQADNRGRKLTPTMVVSPEKLRSFRILVTDDDASWRDGIRDVLESRGYQTIEAETGEEAIDIVHQERVHLLMIDFQLPQMDGVETLRVIRQEQQRQFKELPAILVSSAVDDNVLAQALALHAFTVMSKMVGIHRIIYTVARAMEKYYALHQEMPPGDDSQQSNEEDSQQ